MSHRPPPQDIVDRFGYLPDVQYIGCYEGNYEYSSACPQCGGGRGGTDPSDRFRFWERPGRASNFWCRRCPFQGFADDNKPYTKPSVEVLLELEELRRRQVEQENKRLRVLIEQLRKDAVWVRYHNAMGEGHRALWRQAGIPDSLQDYWRLGFLPNYRGKSGDDYFESPALSIPYFANEWQATTIQYRLTSPPAPKDKYRFQSGLDASLWLADPDSEVKNAVLLCEGMKKAAVTFIQTVASGIGKFVITAVPSKMPGQDLLQLLANADPLYICLDPDAYMPTRTPQGKLMKSAVSRLASMIKTPKRIVRLPCKSDDFFMLYGGTARDFMKFVEGGVRG